MDSRASNLSNLWSEKYGYDFVVATTQASINSDLRVFQLIRLALHITLAFHSWLEELSLLLLCDCGCMRRLVYYQLILC